MASWNLRTPYHFPNSHFGAVCCDLRGGHVSLDLTGGEVTWYDLFPEFTIFTAESPIFDGKQKKVFKMCQT